MDRPSILCAIDFTHASDEALRVAVIEARRRDAILDVIHVWYPADPLATDMAGIGLPVLNTESPAELEQALDSIPVDLPADQVRRHLAVGSVAEQIVETARRLNTSMLIVGTHARGVLGRWFIGSIASELLRTAPCPILVCRQPHPVDDDSGKEQPEDAASET